jgi:nitroreductase
MEDVMTFAGLLLAAALLAPAEPVPAAALELPPPRKTGGLPLMEALARRASSREYDAREVPLGHLSSLLWAGFGVNRPDGHRTAPSARNWQEVDIYVLLKEGAFLYDAKAHRLVPVLAGDARALAGTQDFAKTAPLTLVYVADLARMGSGSAAEKEPMAWVDTGFISQNVYLYCASEGLATVVRASVDKPALGAKLSLRPDQRIIVAQSVGFPKR